MERHAGVRPAEDPQRRHPQVRWRDDLASAGDLCSAGAAARCRRQSAWRRRRGGRDCGNSRLIDRLVWWVCLRSDALGVGQGLSVGLLVSLLFALVPLLEVRRVKPLLLLRGGDATVVVAGSPVGATASGVVHRAGAFFRSVDWLQFGVGAVVTAALVVVASWQAASLAGRRDRLRSGSPPWHWSFTSPRGHSCDR